MSTVAVIQARMGSTRLPGKVLRPLAGTTALAHVVRRVRACALVDRIVVATTTHTRDDVVAAEATRCQVPTFRGSEEDVLARYYHASTGAAEIVRVTADCPLFDPQLLTRMLQRFFAARAYGRPLDYLSNTVVRTFPKGLDAEVFTRAALVQAHDEARSPYEREHVTPYLYQHPDRFVVEAFTGSVDLSHHRWTLDTEVDYRFLQGVFAALDNGRDLFTTDAVLALLRERPELTEIGGPCNANGSGA